LREPVRFGAGLETLFEHPERLLLEVGPGRTLRTLAQQHPGRPAELTAVASLHHPDAAASDQQGILTALGRLWLAGATVDWTKFVAHERRLRIALPTYPFEGRRFWSEPTPNGTRPHVAAPAASAPMPEPAPAGVLLEEILAQQLELLACESELMTQQLELLAGSQPVGVQPIGY
jgi:acyl transferase domain-containing protein